MAELNDNSVKQYLSTALRIASHPIRREILKILKNGDSLSTSEINKILGRVDEMAFADENINIPFVIGETVKVIDGPFNSFHADIESIDEQKKKLKLIVKIFGRKTPLELNFMQVEKI